MNYKEILSITINGKQNAIRISKNVIKALGNPKYVCLRVNNNYSSIAILPCSSGDPLSFKVPDEFISKAKSDFRIHSKCFVRSVFTGSRFDVDLSYVFIGTFLEKNNAVVFETSTVKILEQ